MEITRNDENVVAVFEDVIEFAEFANTVPAGNYSKKDTYDRIEFTGGTYADAIKQATTGNPELVTELFDGVNVLEAMIEEEKVGEIRDVTGEYFDVADFLSGEPEVFRREEIGFQKPVVPIYATLSMYCGISNKMIKNRGCAIVALVDELSRSGFIVDLNLVVGLRHDGKNYYAKIKVRTDPLDIDTVAFIIANPLCFRRLCFSFLELSSGESYCGGYGFPIEYDLSEIFSTGLSGFYFVSSSHSEFRSDNYRTLESAKAHILGMIEQFKESASQIILG